MTTNYQHQNVPYRGEQLAFYIAEQLEDTSDAAMRTHRKYVSKYRPEVLLEILAYVINKPEREISTSRARYYNWLVQNYGRTGSIPRH